MKKLKCVTVDDDPFILKVLRDLINAHERLELVAECSNSNIAALSITKLKPAVVFLDILLPGLNGLEMLDVLEHKPNIVIVSGIQDVATKISGHPCVIDCLTKPVLPKKFRDAVQKSIAKISQANNGEYILLT